MQSAKQEINNLLNRLPDDCSFEDIQYHLYVLQKIERGLKDASGSILYKQINSAIFIRLILLFPIHKS